MAFCTGSCGCGDPCYRQDDHGGGCDCGEDHHDQALASVTYTLYAVADDSDLTTTRWYRTYSQSRSSGWVKDFSDAKIWTKKGPAQGKCTSLGAGAKLVEFVATKVNVIDQRERLKQAVEKKRLAEEFRRRSAAEQELATAERALQMAQEKVRSLKKG